MTPPITGEPNAMALSQLSRGKLPERLFEILKREILSGKWKDGERLPPIEQLASQVRVSRTVMREVLQKLSSIGLIEMRHGSGTYVKRLSASMLIGPMMDALSFEDNSTYELIEVGYHLEQVAARFAAARAKDGDIGFLTGIHESMSEAMRQGDLTAFAQHDFMFHFTLARIARNHILRTIIILIRKMMQHSLELPGVTDYVLEDHYRIVKAIEERNPDAAEKAMKFHMQHVLNNLKSSFEWEGEFPF